MDKEKIQKISKDLFEEMNKSSTYEFAQVMADEFIRTHRTLQQNFIRTLYEFLKIVAETNCSDARNRASMKWIKDITSKIIYFPFI